MELNKGLLQLFFCNFNFTFVEMQGDIAAATAAAAVGLVTLILRAMRASIC
ncbi:hypothetical protein HanRHA438_Chr09g0413121 [Helianthus annuus]|nr:hypothetical protein HanHA300_Chr09g0329401 [Helianthus annuus]KAJ0535590.1 hypothetical protein HanIR_Chr09g0432291 [Helianthus annuus]KAJ0543401.1 hypothetical protein HanHA89_Chr09g0350291 [Helianthus annuus]KAJ0708459.1 hypothetical protein HanLR1_Chr09g0329641 [Helianthus annuus]KAJ0712385.1 hypothetical protein HanOQP8_Chr09g0334251 [Helianthus annuus]